MKCSLNNALKVGDDLLKAFCKLLFACVHFKRSAKEDYVAKILHAIWDTFYMKIIVTLIPIDLFLLLSLFRSIFWSKNENQFFRKLLVWQWKKFLLIFIASRTLLQSHAEFNKLLYWNFRACYFCSFIVLWYINLEVFWCLQTV